MGTILSDSGNSNVELIEPGIHPAVCIWMYDVGTQKWEWQGQPKEGGKLVVVWELPQQRMEYDGKDKPRVISNTYTQSIGSKSNLRKMLMSWRGRDFTPEELSGFDIKTIVGVSCQIQVIHNEGTNGKTYANIQNVLPAGGQKYTPENPTVAFDVDKDDIPEHCPKWIREKIEKSPEWQMRNTGGSLSGDINQGVKASTTKPTDKFNDEPFPGGDDIPF